MVAPRILLTRPEPGASKTAASLASKGLDVIKVPFTEMKPRSVTKGVDQAAQFNAVVVTSANALRHADSSLLEALAKTPVYAVGDATAEVARARGFQDVKSANGNALDLCRLLKQSLETGATIAYLCGVTRTDDIELILRDASFLISIFETYETIKVSQLTYKIDSALSGKPVNGISFYSSVSAKLFSEEVYSSFSHYNFDSTTIFCISDRAAMNIPNAFLGRIYVCSAPRDDEMVKLICQHYSR